jgi:hypothetical protein
MEIVDQAEADPASRVEIAKERFMVTVVVKRISS